MHDYSVAETRIALKNVGKINPGNIDDYIAAGGYSALAKALRIPRKTIIDELFKAGLRGRGGAGFSAGLKERFTSDSSTQAGKNFVVCNADEGEPGTFKDRIIMEKDPHLLIEGILLAAYAIGASKAYIYIRAEYHKSIEMVERAIKSAAVKELTGNNILDSGKTIDIEMRLGAGSYLCGEELTLLESLEGRRGYPRIKPPFPAKKGLFGYPTLVNNVETLATIPSIIEQGSDWYLQLGTEDTPGTKIFSLSGDVDKPGYYEVEFGITLRELIHGFGGGITDGKKLKAVLLGGAAGTFVDATVLDTPTGFDSFKEKGAVIGSGAVIVLSEESSIPLMTRSILRFFEHESCGKCVPCRIGMTVLARMLDDLIAKDSGEVTLDRMVDEAVYMANSSLCPLGQSPILPLRSLQRYFSHEFGGH